METGEEVTLDKSIPRPERWERVDGYYFRRNGKKIHEEAYYAKVKDRIILSKYLDEVEPPEVELPDYV